MKTEVVHLDVGGRVFTDLTDRVRSFVAGEGDGLVHVFVPHATAAVALFETGSGTEQDLEAALERLLPIEDIYAHRHGSLGHGRDHVVPGFLSSSVTVPVVNGEPALGTWQSIVLVDTNADNPERMVRFSLLSG